MNVLYNNIGENPIFPLIPNIFGEHQHASPIYVGCFYILCRNPPTMVLFVILVELYSTEKKMHVQSIELQCIPK